MKLMKRIWFRIGNHYRKKRDFEQALKYMRKGESAITSFNDKLHYAELLHNSGHSEEAVAYLGRVIDTSGSHRAYERRAHILRELNREREAIEDLNEAIRLNADNYMNWYTRGIAHKDLNQYEEAIRDLKESIKREDRSTVISTYYELGMTFYESGNPAEAAHYFRLSIQEPERAIPMYYYMLSVSLDLMDHVQEAVGVLQEGIQLADRYEAEADGGYALFAGSTNYSYGAFQTFQRQVREAYSFRKSMADLYVQLGDMGQAEHYLSEAIERYPDSYELYLKRAEVFNRSGNKNAAKADLEWAIEAAPDDYRAYFDMARIYREDGLEDQAYELISKLYARQPDSPLACYWMADCYYRLGRQEEALAINDKLLKLENDDAPNYVQRADIYMEMNDLASAEQALKEAASLQDGTEIRNKLSYVLYLQGRNEEALLELQEAVKQEESFSEHPTYLAASGHIYKEMGMWDLAIDAYSQAIQAHPSNPRFYEFRAVCFVETGQLERGLADCAQGLSLNPGQGSLYSLRSGIYYSMADYARAKEDTLQVLELSPGHPGAYFRLGQIYYKDQDEDAALAAFDEVLRLVPEHADSYLYKAHIYYGQFEHEDAIQAIVNWSLHLQKEMPPADKIQAIEGLEGFEESLLNKAVERLTGMYGHQLYLS